MKNVSTKNTRAMRKRANANKPQRDSGPLMYQRSSGFPRDKDVYYAGPNKPQISKWPYVGIPDRVHCKLTYGESFALTAANTVEYHYRGNGMYDPRAATGGGQPHYFDQMMALYQQFYVKRAICSVSVVNRSSNDTVGVGLFSSSETTGLSDFYEVEEQQENCVFLLIPPAQGGDTKRLVVEETTKHALELPASDQTTWGNNAADPTNLWYFRAYVQNLTQLSTTSGWLSLKIVYDCEFFDRREVTPSLRKTPPPSHHKRKSIEL